jgi:hypothetical protein
MHCGISPFQTHPRSGPEVERTGQSENGIRKSSVEPDFQLARDFQGGQRFGVIAGMIMSCAIASGTDLVKEFSNLPRRDTLEIEPPKKVELRLLR